MKNYLITFYDKKTDCILLTVEKTAKSKKELKSFFPVTCKNYHYAILQYNI